MSAARLSGPLLVFAPTLLEVREVDRRELDAAARERVIAEKLRPSAFPRSARYDPEWVLENLMGPNGLWLVKSLSEVLELQPGMRVLDMGCGKVASR